MQELFPAIPFAFLSVADVLHIGNFKAFTATEGIRFNVTRLFPISQGRRLDA